MCYECVKDGLAFTQCCVKDEGRPLEIDLQELVSNHLMLHWLRAIVVSDKEKVLLKGSGNDAGDDWKGTADEMS